MALKIRTIGNPDLIGDIQPGWSIDENATPHAIGDGSASVGGVQFSAGRRDDSEFLLNKPVTVYYEPEGTVAAGNNVTGVFDSVDASGGSVGVTSTNKLGTLTAERRAEPIFPNKLYNSFTDPTNAGAVILSLAGLDVDPSGNLYAVDRGYAINRVARYDPNGTYLGDFNLVEPASGVTISASGRVYVQPGVSGNYGSVYGPEGGFLYFLNDNLGGDTSTNGPAAIDPAGNVYIFAGGQDRVKKFNSSGAFVATYGNGRGTGDGFFGGAVGSGVRYSGPIVADSSNFFVLDVGNNRIQSFTSAGAFSSKFSVPSGAIGMKATPAGNLLVSHSGGMTEYTKAGALVRTTAAVPGFWAISGSTLYYSEVPNFSPQMQSRWQVRRASYPGRVVDPNYMPGNGPVVGGDTANSLPFIFNSVSGTYMVPSPTTNQINEYDLSGNRISTFAFNMATTRLDIRDIDYSYDGTIYGFAQGVGGVYSMPAGGAPVLLGASPRASAPFSVHRPSGDYYYADYANSSIVQRDKFGNNVAARGTGLGASSISSIFVGDDRTIYFSILSGASTLVGVYKWISGATNPVRIINPGSLALGLPIVDTEGGRIFIPDSYTLTGIRGSIFLREYTLDGAFVRTDVIPGASPYEGFYGQIVAPRTLAIRTGVPKSISLSPTGAPALSSALTIYLSYTGRAPIFSGTNPAAVYPGWTDSVWSKLNELCAATGKEIVLQNDAIIVRDVASATISLDNFIGSPQRSAEKGSGRHVEVVNQNTSVVSGGVVFDYRRDQGRTFSVDVNEVNTTNLSVDTWLVSVQQPVPALGQIGAYVAQGSYTVLSADGLSVPPALWQRGGGSLFVEIAENGTSIDVTTTGPTEAIPGYQAPYTVGSIVGTSRSTGLSILGSGVAFSPQVVRVATGADWSIVSEDVSQTINQPFITDLTTLYDRAEFATPEGNGTAQVLSFSIPMSDIGGLGLTAGAMFLYNKAWWRIRSSKIGNAAVNITAVCLTTVGQHDAVVTGETIGAHDARLAALTLGDSALKPLY